MKVVDLMKFSVLLVEIDTMYSFLLICGCVCFGKALAYVYSSIVLPV